MSKTMWRGAFLAAAVIWGVFATASAELLSFIHLLEFGPLLVIWVAACLILLAACVARREHVKAALRLGPVRLTTAETILLVPIGMIAILTGFIAVLAAPNLWDSMTYHMARIPHWLQDRSIAFYPTHITRQLYSAPWAEIAIMHFQVLTGGDRFANVVGWFSQAGCLIGVSAIAAEFGGNRQTQLFTALTAATVPMAILQATSTQNNLAVTFWLVCTAFFTLQANHQGLGRVTACGFGASLGLLIFTKGTGYAFGFPFVVWLTIIGIRQQGWQFWRTAALITAIVVALNAWLWINNFTLFANPVGDANLTSNSVYGPAPLASNIVRNLALQIYAPDQAARAAIEGFIEQIHSFLRLSINDPRTTFRNTQFAVMQAGITSILAEDTAASPFHLALGAIATGILISASRLRKRQSFLPFFGAIMAMFILYCAAFKWQPWGNRLFVPILILFTPVTAIALSPTRLRTFPIAAGLALFVLAVPTILFNPAHPLISINILRPLYDGRISQSQDIASVFSNRIDQYFANKPLEQEAYEAAASVVKSTNCSRVGIITNVDSWEYPFWVLLNSEPSRPVRIEHVNVQNQSTVLSSQPEFASFQPCAIVTLEMPPHESPQIVDGVSFARVYTSPYIEVFLPDR